MVDFDEIVDKVEEKIEDVVDKVGEKADDFADKFSEDQKRTSKRNEGAPPNPPKKAPNMYAVIAIVAGVAIVAAVIFTLLLVNASNKQKELKGQLTDAEKEMEVLRDANEKLKKEKKDLRKQIDDLLDIEEPDPVITTAQIEEQLVSLRELITAKYIYKNAARMEGNKTWIWGWTLPFSDTSLLATYEGYIKAGIDLNKVEISVNENTRTITVKLPPSEVTDNNIPQETITVLEVKNNLFNEITFDEYNTFIAAEKPKMEDEAIRKGLLTDANVEAQAAIKAFLNLIPGMDTYTLIVN